MDRHQRKAAIKRWKHAEEADLVTTMPLTSAQLHRLVCYLDANLTSCDYTTMLTRMFLQGEKLAEEPALRIG